MWTFKNIIRAFQLFAIWALCQLFCHFAIGQDREIEFKISRLKSAVLYPDSVCVLKIGDTLRLKLLGGLTTADIAGVDFNKGTTDFSDSLITIIVTQASMRPMLILKPGDDTAATGDYLDSATVKVRLKPGVHCVSEFLTKVVYIIQQPPSPGRNGKSGFYIRWNNTTVTTMGYKFRRRARTIHHFTKEKLLDELAYAFKYQNYYAKDTSMKNFDSLYAVISVKKKMYRFHVIGSSVSPDIMDTIRMMHMGDRMRVKLYCTSEKNLLRRESILIRLSLFNYNEEVTL